MTTIIIEDEKPAARRMQRMLEKLEVKVQQTLHSVEDSINWLQNNQHPDVIFLDIQLSDGLSFEIFEHINLNSFIIFTTAYDEYALHAFKLNSIDYLLKPIDDEELLVAIKKYNKLQKQFTSISTNDVQLHYQEIKKLFVNPAKKVYKKRFTIKVGQYLKMIPIQDIACFFSENKGVYIHTLEGRNYLIDSTLESLTEELDPSDFFRVNRKFFININAIKNIVTYSNSRLKIQLNSYSDEEIIVARERVKEFKVWIA